MSPLSASGIRVEITPRCGMLRGLVIERAGRTIRPLHRAPWVEAGEAMLAGEAPHLALLEGDFFCAPFGVPSEEGVPAHGWPANGDWTEAGRSTGPDGSVTARFDLAQTVRGATVEKTVRLSPGHPVVYQTHRIRGGEGAAPLAHHAMIHVPGGARLSFSRKVFGATPAGAPEADPARGRSILLYHQRFESLAAVRLAGGGEVDATTYPFAERHEDLVALFDPPEADLAWSAAVAAKEGFVFFALKDPHLLNQTILWMSNRGRLYPPWNGRHGPVLGIEEACTHFGDGEAVSVRDNELSRQGWRTALPLGATTIRYALGAIPLPEGWTEIASIEPHEGRLTLTDVGGGSETVPFDHAFIHGSR